MQESGKEAKRIDVRYFDGVNSTVQHTLAKNTEMFHMENARSPVVGTLEKREGQVKYGTATDGGDFSTEANTALFKFTSALSQAGVYRISKTDDVASVNQYTGNSLSMGQQVESHIHDIKMTVDGTKLYILADRATIFQYNLSTLYDISSAVYADKSLEEESRLGYAGNFTLENNGTKLFIAGGVDGLGFEGRVHQYTLLTAYDISSARYDDTYYDTDSESGEITGISFKSDGTKMYILGDDIDEVLQYSLSTAWDVSSASFDSVSFSVNSGSERLMFKTDGSKMFTYNSSGYLYEYTLSTPWDLSTAGSMVSNDISGWGDIPTSHVSAYFFTDSGNKILLSSEPGFAGSEDAVFSVDLTSAWSASGHDTYGGDIKYVGKYADNVQGMRFNTNGTKVFFATLAGLSDNRSDISAADLSTAYDITTAVYNGEKLETNTSYPRGLAFNDDGTKLYSLTASRIEQYTLTTPWEISTASYDSVFLDLSTQGTTATGIYIEEEDRQDIFVCFDGDSSIAKYHMTSDWDLSTASFVTGQTADLSDIITSLTELYFSDDGKTLFASDNTEDTVYQFALSTEWDLTTVSYDDVYLYIGDETSSPRALEFSPDGTRLFVGDYSNDGWTDEYSMLRPWVLSEPDYFSISAYDHVNVIDVPNDSFLPIFISDEITVSDSELKSIFDVNTLILNGATQYGNLFALDSSNHWRIVDDPDAYNLIGDNWSSTKIGDDIVLVNGHDYNRLLREDGVTVESSLEANSIYNSPRSRKVAHYRDRIYLGGYKSNGVDYKSSVIRSSQPMGIIALVDGDVTTSTTIPVTESKYFYTTSGMNQYEVYRGGTKIETLTVTTVNETSIEVSAAVTLDSSDEIWISGTYDGEKQYRWVNNASASGRDVKQYDTFKMSSDDESEITLLEPIGGMLMIANKSNIAYWDDYNLQTLDLGIGCASPNGYTKKLGSVFFIDHSGIYKTSGGAPQLISRKIEKYIRGATKEGIESSTASFNGTSIFFTIGDVDLYYNDGDFWKTLNDVALEYSLTDDNWYVHTNVPADFLLNINDGSERLLMAHSGDGKFVKEFLNGNTDDGDEIFMRVDTQPIQFLQEFEAFVHPIAIHTETERGSSLLCLVSIDTGRNYDQVEGVLSKGISTVKITSKDKDSMMPISCNKLQVSYRDNSKQRCRINQFSIEYLPTTKTKPAGRIK